MNLVRNLVACSLILVTATSALADSDGRQRQNNVYEGLRQSGTVHTMQEGRNSAAYRAPRDLAEEQTYFNRIERKGGNK